MDFLNIIRISRGPITNSSLCLTRACAIEAVVRVAAVEPEAQRLPRRGIRKLAFKLYTPKLPEPGIVAVGPEIEGKVVIVKPVNVRGLNANGNAPHRLFFHLRI